MEESGDFDSAKLARLFVACGLSDITRVPSSRKTFESCRCKNGVVCSRCGGLSVSRSWVLQLSSSSVGNFHVGSESIADSSDVGSLMVMGSDIANCASWISQEFRCKHYL